MQEQRQRRHVRERRIEEEKAASRKPPQEHQLAQRPDGSIDLSATSPPPPQPPVSHDHTVHGTRQQDADRTQAREDWGGEFHQLREQVAGLLALLREREGAVRDREGGGLRDAAGGAWLQRDIRPGDDAPTTAGGRAMGTESMSSPQARAALDEAGPEEVAGEHSKGRCNGLSELQSQVGVGSILPWGQEPVGMQLSRDCSHGWGVRANTCELDAHTVHDSGRRLGKAAGRDRKNRGKSATGQEPIRV